MSVFYLDALGGSALAFAVCGTVVDALAKIGTLHLPLLGKIASWWLTFLVVGLPGLFFAFFATSRGRRLRILGRASWMVSWPHTPGKRPEEYV